MTRFVHEQSTAGGYETWKAGELTLHMWPAGKGYMAQDSLLQSWTLTEQEHALALVEGLEHAMTRGQA